MSSPPHPQPSYSIPNNNLKTKNRRPSPSSSPPTLTPSETASNLPPPRPLNKENRLNPLLRNVEPPLYNTRLSTLIYVLVGLTSLLMVYYSYRGVKVQSANASSGHSWWSLIMGGGGGGVDEIVAATTTSSRSAGSTTKANIDTVESHIIALAAALGVPTHDLAAAIAGAVRAHVPPASLSSIKEKETGEVVRVLFEEPEATDAATAAGGHGKAWEAASTAAGVVGGVVEGVENLVGMMD